MTSISAMKKATALALGAEGLFEAEMARLLAEFAFMEQFQFALSRRIVVRAGRDSLRCIDYQVGVYQTSAVVGRHRRGGRGQQRLHPTGGHRLAGEPAG